MKKISINNCPACEPVSNLVNELLENKFEIITERIEDYHFHQLYIKLKGDLKKMNTISDEGFKVIDNKYICDCHWSTIEIVPE